MPSPVAAQARQRRGKLRQEEKKVKKLSTGWVLAAAGTGIAGLFIIGLIANHYRTHQEPSSSPVFPNPSSSPTTSSKVPLLDPEIQALFTQREEQKSLKQQQNKEKEEGKKKIKAQQEERKAALSKKKLEELIEMMHVQREKEFSGDNSEEIQTADFLRQLCIDNYSSKAYEEAFERFITELIAKDVEQPKRIKKRNLDKELSKDEINNALKLINGTELDTHKLVEGFRDVYELDGMIIKKEHPNDIITGKKDDIEKYRKEAAKYGKIIVPHFKGVTNKKNEEFTIVKKAHGSPSQYNGIVFYLDNLAKFKQAVIDFYYFVHYSGLKDLIDPNMSDAHTDIPAEAFYSYYFESRKAENIDNFFSLDMNGIDSFFYPAYRNVFFSIEKPDNMVYVWPIDTDNRQRETPYYRQKVYKIMLSFFPYHAETIKEVYKELIKRDKTLLITLSKLFNIYKNRSDEKEAIRTLIQRYAVPKGSPKKLDDILAEYTKLAKAFFEFVYGTHKKFIQKNPEVKLSGILTIKRNKKIALGKAIVTRFYTNMNFSQNPLSYSDQQYIEFVDKTMGIINHYVSEEVKCRLEDNQLPSRARQLSLPNSLLKELVQLKEVKAILPKDWSDRNRKRKALYEAIYEVLKKNGWIANCLKMEGNLFIQV